MKIQTLLAFGTALFLGVGFLQAQDNPTLTVVPNKILYEPGETAKFDLAITNGTKNNVKGTLLVKVTWEMEDSQKIKEEGIELAAGEKKTITAEWKTSDILGCEVRADLMDGANVIATGADYFNVCKTKEVQRVGIHVEYPDLFTYPEKEYLDTIPQKVASLRQAYGNISEHFGWCPDNYAELAPKRDEWCSNYWHSKVAIKKAIAEEQKYGMKVLHYAAGYLWSLPGAEMMRRHPDWVFYRENGQPWGGGVLDVRKLDFERNPDRRAINQMAGGGVQGIFPNFAIKEALDYGAQQLIDSKEMFNWDGVRFDGHYLVWTGVCPGALDIAGKPVISGKEGDAANRFNTDFTRKKVAEKYPDFLFMFNSGVHDPDIAEICRDGGATANEPIRESFSVTSQWNTWKAFADYMLDDVAGARKNGGFAYAYMNPPWEVCPNVDRIQYALLLAAGDHPWFSFPAMDRKVDRGGSHYPIQKDYFRFATRFSSALWGRGIERVQSPEEIVEVTPTQGKIWWREFVHQRKLANGKTQLVVHLINEPPTQKIEMETQQLAAPLKDISVKFKKPVNKVWYATSEPQMTCLPLTVQNGSVTVPELRVWSMIIVEMEDK